MLVQVFLLLRSSTHTHTHTDTHTQTHTHTDTDTQTQTHRHRHTDTDRHRHRQTQTQTDTDTDTHTHTHTHTHLNTPHPANWLAAATHRSFVLQQKESWNHVPLSATFEVCGYLWSGVGKARCFKLANFVQENHHVLGTELDR